MKNNNDFLTKIFDTPFRTLESKVLKNVLMLGLFEELTKPVSAEKVAEIKSWHMENTKVLLQTLVALRYVKKFGDEFVNTEDTNKYLVNSGEYYIGTFILVFDSYIGSAFPEDIEDLLKNGPKSFEETQNMDVDYAQMINTLRAYQSGYPQAQFRDLLKEYSEYKDARKILDLGCGTGMIGLSFAKDNSEAEIVLYDLPQMQGAIEESVKMANVNNNVTVKTGDFTSDDIGSGYNVVFASNAVYAAKSKMDETIQKIYQSLNDGGIFMCISDGIEDEFSGPWDMVLSWMAHRMNNMDMSVPKGMVEKAAIKSGFNKVSKETMHLIGGRFDVEVYKK